MENSCSCLIRYGELFFVATPEQAKAVGGMEIEVINTSDDHSVVDMKEPFITKPSASSPGNDQPKVRYDKSLGGELKRGTTYLV